MAVGTKIIASAEPRGHYEGIILSGTPYPGTCMEIVGSTNPVGGRFTYRARTLANGSKGPVAVLIEDDLQGFAATQIGVSGTARRIYWPAAGEELNMLVNEGGSTGTASIVNIGDLLSVQNNGELIASTSTSAPFCLLEHPGVNAGDALRLTKYLGNNA